MRWGLVGNGGKRKRKQLEIAWQTKYCIAFYSHAKFGDQLTSNRGVFFFSLKKFLAKNAPYSAWDFSWKVLKTAHISNFYRRPKQSAKGETSDFKNNVLISFETQVHSCQKCRVFIKFKTSKAKKKREDTVAFFWFKHSMNLNPSESAD